MKNESRQFVTGLAIALILWLFTPVPRVLNQWVSGGLGDYTFNDGNFWNTGFWPTGQSAEIRDAVGKVIRSAQVMDGALTVHYESYTDNYAGGPWAPWARAVDGVVEARVRVEGDGAAAVFWRMNNDGHGYVCSISNANGGTYECDKYRSNTWLPIERGYSNDIHIGDYNTIRLFGDGSTVLFEINGHTVETFNDLAAAQGRWGAGGGSMGGRCTIAFDEIRIDKAN